jgi:hypothetical protein
MNQRPHRPVPLADLADLVDAHGGYGLADRSELAASTAAAVVAAGRAQSESDATARLVALSDLVGLDTLSELWREAEPATLAWSLWTLYLLRRWCHDDADEVARLWRDGRGLAPADEVVAGVADAGGPAPIAQLADAVLRGVYRGELAVALERAAAFFRVIAAGRRATTEAAGPAERADRNERVADLLCLAAVREREGQLT